MVDWGINVTRPTFSPTIFQSEGYWMVNRDTWSLYVQNASIAYARVITNIIIIIAAIKKAEETKRSRCYCDHIFFHTLMHSKCVDRSVYKS